MSLSLEFLKSAIMASDLSRLLRTISISVSRMLTDFFSPSVPPSISPWTSALSVYSALSMVSSMLWTDSWLELT